MIFQGIDQFRIRVVRGKMTVPKIRGYHCTNVQ